MPFIAPIIGAIGSAVAAAGSFVAGLGAFGQALIGVGMSLGLSALSKAIAPKPKAGSALTGLETQVQIGGDIPRQICVGRVAVKGQLVYHNTNGNENQFYQQVYALSDWPCDGIEAVILNGKRYEIAPSGAAGQGWTNYNGVGFSGIAIRFYDGTQAAADPYLIANANPSGRWTADSILSGICYVALFFTYDKDNALFEGGLPDVSFVIRGAKLYDWRKDDTNGGVGTHRWDQPATWEFSENPIVATYNFQRGFHVNGHRILGMGTQSYDLIHETYTAAANICDETVVTTGDPEARYRCAAILTADPDVPYASSLEALLSTCAGYLYDYGGSYFAQAGAAQSVVKTITDDDLVVGEPVTFAAKRTRADLVNSIHGQYLEPASDYVEQSYTPQTSEPGLLEDGEEFGIPLDLMAVPSRTQAERIARIRLRESRCQKTAAITLGFNHIDLQAGDWIEWQSSRASRSGVYRIVEKRPDRATGRVGIELAEINAQVFSWSASDEGVPQPLPVPIVPGARPGTVSNFAVAAEALLNDDGTVEVPALVFSWIPVTDQTVDAVVIEYRRIGASTSHMVTDLSPEDGTVQVTDGIVNATEYEARATIKTTPSRITVWTPWVPVRTTDNYNVNAVAVLAAQIKRQVEEIMPSRIRDVEERLAQLGAIAADIDAGNALQSEQIRRELRGRIANVVAFFQEEIEIAFGPESAFAQAITELYAAINNVEANIKVRFVAAATPEGALAAYELKAQAGTSYAGMTVIAESEEDSVIMLDADRFYVRQPNELGGEPVPVFGISTVNGETKVALVGSVIADGSITTNKISVGELSAINANMGEITAGKMTSPDGLMVLDLNEGRLVISEAA